MTAPIITIFKNGDTFHNGKRLVLNRKEIRSFDAFLDRVTKDTHSKVAVRSIRTPSHGHRVSELDKLENGGIYVAVGPERFKKLEYKEFNNLPTHKAKPAEQVIKPVVHSRVIVSGRARKVAAAETTANKTIFVFRNGDDKHPSFKILLDKRILHTGMDTILQFITEKVRLRTGAVKSLYTLDGIEIHEPSQIKSLEKYVAVGYGKKFLKMAYNENGATSLTPRRGGPKIKSTSSEPPHRKKRPRPPVKAMSQGHVKSPPKSETMDKEDSSSGAERSEENNENGRKQSSDDHSIERSLTQDLQNTDTRASSNNENDNADNANANASRKASVDIPSKQNARKVSDAKDEAAVKKHSTAKEEVSTSSNRKDSKAKETKGKPAAERRKAELKAKLKEENKKKTSNAKPENEVEVDDNNNANDDSEETVFKATGDQGEKAITVKDNEDTNVEKPLDMLPAEEVEEELDDNEKEAPKNDEVSVEDRNKDFYAYAQRNRFKAKRDDVDAGEQSKTDSKDDTTEEQNNADADESQEKNSSRKNSSEGKQ